MQENNTNGQKQNSGAQKQTGLSWSTPSTNNNPAHKPVMPVKTPTPMVSSSSSSKSSAQGGMAAKYLGMIVAGLLAGVAVAWAWSSWHPSSDVTTNSSNTQATGTNLGVDTTSMPALGSDAALTILSPQPAGTSVAVEKAIVSSPTWIVVYEDNDGKPGNALGAALFFPERQTGTVELLRATTPGKSYLAVKQTDSGDRKFSLKDDAYLSEGGEVQWVTFETR